MFVDLRAAPGVNVESKVESRLIREYIRYELVRERETTMEEAGGGRFGFDPVVKVMERDAADRARLK